MTNEPTDKPDKPRQRSRRSARIEALVPEVIALWDEGRGLPATAIAAQLAVSATAVLHVLHTEPGVANRPGKHRRDYVTGRAIANEDKRDLRARNANLTIDPATPQQLSDDEIDSLVRMYHGGLGHLEIAAQTGLTEWTVYRALKRRLGQQMRRSGPRPAHEFTPEELTRMAADYKAGLTLAQVGAMWAIPATTARHLLSKDPTVVFRKRGPQPKQF